MDDLQIVELYHNRSEIAVAITEEKYGSYCRKIAHNILSSNEDAEECVNDTYLGAWNTIPPQKPKPLLTYICRIARNISIKRYHQNTAKKRNSYYDVALDELEACLPSSIMVQDEVSASELTSLIDDFLGGLDKTNRIMFVRRYWFSDSISDIATRFNLSKHAVTVRLSRTRERLRQYLIKKGVTI